MGSRPQTTRLSPLFFSCSNEKNCGKSIRLAVCEDTIKKDLLERRELFSLCAFNGAISRRLLKRFSSFAMENQFSAREKSLSGRRALGFSNFHLLALLPASFSRSGRATWDAWSASYSIKHYRTNSFPRSLFVYTRNLIYDVFLVAHKKPDAAASKHEP